LCAQLTCDLFAIAKFLLMIGRLLLHCWYSLGRPVTIGTPMVLTECFWRLVQKQSKDSQTAKKWPLVYQSSHVYTESAEYIKPRKRRYLAKPPSHVPGQWPQPVGWADCMCLHWRPCVWLPFAAACCYTLLPADDACSSSSLSTTVIKFSIFSDPTRQLSALPPNSVEYGNCKTTTLLPSAKCTRPLFQGRTGCGGRPSGWHDNRHIPASSLLPAIR